jgi:hypothetical protein
LLPNKEIQNKTRATSQQNVLYVFIVLIHTFLINFYFRLSAVASAKLTDGNPNIADLSDANRPTKLAEQYSELYDNEWTDAFDVLSKNRVPDEQAACRMLLEIFCVSINIKLIHVPPPCCILILRAVFNVYVF